MKLKIGILGSRGIPNQYGGFEQFAQYLSRGLVQKGHEVSVYNSHHHFYQKDNWKGVQIIHCYDPELMLGTGGQFIYDFNCLRDARKRSFDVLLILGYTSSSVWGRYFPRGPVIITNMDGLEWKRTKYRKPVRKFVKLAEKLAVKHSDFLVADSRGVQEYLLNEYQVNSRFIAYGATVNYSSNESILALYGLEKHQYYMLMARMEPENNIEVILDGFSSCNSEKKFLVVGNTSNKFGRYLMAKYKNDPRILFCGAVYNYLHVHNLRRFAVLYFHGHSVGGTNPSLLEAMASGVLIAAHDNPFNKAILQDNAYYFSNAAEVCKMLEHKTEPEKYAQMIEHNRSLIETTYSWENIINHYETFFLECKNK